MALQLRQHMFEQVSIQDLAVDVFPAGMRCTHANAFTWNQQYAVGNAEEPAALANELGKPRMAARHAMNFLVNLVDQR